MHASRATIARATRVLLLTLGAWIAHETTASAQFGYGGIGYGGYGGYGGGGYGGYGGYGGGGYGGFGGYGGGGYGGYGGGYAGYGGLGLNGYGYGYPGYYNAGGLVGAGYVGTGYAGIGYPGVSWLNPYFSFGLSPLAVENAVFERTVLGRTTPPLQSSRTAPPQPSVAPRPSVPIGAVGTGTFGNP
jgi:hypothetical protein